MDAMLVGKEKEITLEVNVSHLNNRIEIMASSHHNRGSNIPNKYTMNCFNFVSASDNG